MQPIPHEARPDARPLGTGGDAAPAHDPALEVRGARMVHRGGRVALDGVDLVVETGTSVALLGPNGSGKSTLISLIAGLLPRAEGAVRVHGDDDRSAIRASLGVVFQGLGLEPHATVMENLLEAGRLHGLDRASARQRAEAGLADLELTDRAGDRVRTLSPGLARRVDLVRALLPRPRLLLLDEPTTGLDPAARRIVAGDLRGRVDDGGLTILIATHLVDEAEAMDRVVLMDRGRLVADGTPAGLRAEAGRLRLRVLSGDFDPASILDPADAEAAEPAASEPAAPETARSGTGGGHGWRLDDPAAAARIAARLAEAGIAFELSPPSLADVFVQRTGRALVAGDAPAARGAAS